jgi:formylglycine-generating enzyme required for sulfatase activity
MLGKGMYILLFSLLTGLMFHPQSVYASNSCQRIYSEMSHSELSADEIQSSLESLWKLYIDKQIASVEANNTNALVSTRERAAWLVQTYKNNITDAHKKIPDFKTIWTEFIKQKMQKQSQSILESAAENTRSRKLESEEEGRRRLQVISELTSSTRKAIFHEIRPGTFLMGESQVKTTITKPYSMMDVQFTQMMWARLKIAMGERDPNKINPAHFKSGLYSITAILDGIEVEMKPNHPIEQVSWDEVKEFIDKLNDLSKSNDEKVQALLQDLFPGHQKSDQYDFPTEAQWEYVKRNLGKSNMIYFDRDMKDIDHLKKYANFSENSMSAEYPDGSTEAVEERLPRIIDGKTFYGLEGNVWEWLKDTWDGSSALPGGVDPIGITGSEHVVIGGSWCSLGLFLRSGHRGIKLSNDKSYTVGFRLVRTRP